MSDHASGRLSDFSAKVTRRPALFNIFIHQCERNMLKASSSLSDALHDDFAATFPLIDAMPQLYALYVQFEVQYPQPKS